MKKFKFFIFLINIPLIFESAFKIRKLDTPKTRKDVVEIANLFLHKDVYEGTSYDPSDICFSLKQGNKSILVAECFDGQIVGVLIASCNLPLPDDFKNNIETASISLEIIATHPSFRNLGVATSLIEYVQSYAVDDQIPCLRLCVFKNNLSALACYKKQGFYSYREDQDCYYLVKKLSYASDSF